MVLSRSLKPKEECDALACPCRCSHSFFGFECGIRRNMPHEHTSRLRPVPISRSPARAPYPRRSAGRRFVGRRAGQQPIFVAKSLDLGHSFQPPVVITQDAATLDWGPDARPKILVDSGGTVIVALRHLPR